MKFRVQLFVTAFFSLLTVESALAEEFSNEGMIGVLDQTGHPANREATVDSTGTETIDTYSGLLQLSYKDAVIPGEGGFDLPIFAAISPASMEMLMVQVGYLVFAGIYTSAELNLICSGLRGIGCIVPARCQCRPTTTRFFKRPMARTICSISPFLIMSQTVMRQQKTIIELSAMMMGLSRLKPGTA